MRLFWRPSKLILFFCELYVEMAIIYSNYWMFCESIELRLWI